MDLIQKIKAEVCQGLPLLEHRYPHDMPDELLPWYVYPADCGHCILAISPDLAYKAFATDKPHEYLIAVSVKSVLRGYKLVDGLVVCTSDTMHYDRNIGLVTPEEDYEY